jgi:glycosyltransferase involved in cell wall biosynthesis
VRLLKVPESKVHVIYEAPAPAFRPIRQRQRLEEVRRRYGLAQRFILYVGTIEPRKNLPRLLEAFARLCRDDGIPHQLVLVGARGWGCEAVFQRIASLGLRDRVRFLGYIPFEDLAPLYNLGEVFLFPSLYEGFGLPVVEAMACGTPVITSANSSFGEIAGGAVVTVDPHDVDSIAWNLKRLLDDPDLRRAVGEKGLARARQFSWRQTAERTLEVYQRVVGGGSISHDPSPATHPGPSHPRAATDPD